MSFNKQTKHKIKAINYALISFGVMVGVLILLHLIVILCETLHKDKPEWIVSIISVCRIYLNQDKRFETMTTRDYEYNYLERDNMLFRLAYRRSG